MSTEEIKQPSLDSMIKANGLSYTMSPIRSLFNQRQRIRYDAQSQSYGPQTTVVVNLSNSDIYVAPRSSYLCFKVTAPQDSTFGVGSAANLLQTVRFIHASGTEIVHNKEVNLWNVVRDRVHLSKRWFDTWGKAKGYGAVLDEDVTQEFCIPLHHICSLFDSDSACPPFLISGSRLEISLASADAGLVVTGATTGYTISDVHVEFDSMILNDSSANSLEKLSAAGRLQYVFNDYTEIQGQYTTNKANIDLTKSIGIATNAWVVPRDSANVSDPKKDSLKPLEGASSVKSYQFRSNSSYFPALPTRSSLQGYLQSVEGLEGKTDYTFDQYSAAGGDNFQVVRQKLERADAVGKTSGLPISASSALRVAIDFQDASSRLVTMFVEHVAVCTPLLYDNIVLEI